MQSRLVWLQLQSGAVPSALSPWGLFGEGFGDQKFRNSVRNPCFAQLLLCFPPPLFCKGCASWEHFACSALLDAWGHRDVPALACSAPIPEGRGMEERPLAQINHPAIKTRWVCTGWEPPLGNTDCTRSSKTHRKDLSPPGSRVPGGIWEALQSPVPGAPVRLCFHSDIPRVALIRVFGELIKFPVREGAVSCAR